MRCVLAALALLLTVGPALAGQDGEWFFRLSDDGRAALGLSSACRSARPEDITECNLVIASALAVHRLMTEDRPELAAYCRRPEPTLEEARASFLRWYARLDMKTARSGGKEIALLTPGAAAVILALRDDSPCR